MIVTEDTELRVSLFEDELIFEWFPLSLTNSLSCNYNSQSFVKPVLQISPFGKPPSQKSKQTHDIKLLQIQ